MVSELGVFYFYRLGRVSKMCRFILYPFFFRFFDLCIFILIKTLNTMQEHILSNGEIVRQIEGFSDYFISNWGNVYSVHHKPKNKSKIEIPSGLKKIKLSIVGSRRYDYANIYSDNGHRASLRVHRLVYQYHNTNGDCLREGYIINHIDHNKRNNHIDNLEQITQSENITLSHKNRRETNV